MYIILSTKIMLTLILVTYVGVHIGNFVWDRNIKIMPWAFKVSLGLIAMAMLASIFNFALAVIWGLI
jgi:hypothetical protein